MNGAAVTSLTLLGAGFILGLKHALDTDHVAVVSTMVSETRNIKKSSLVGALWGLGHTATLLAVGLVILLFKISIPAHIALAVEFVVGLVVIYFGIGLLRKVARGTVHSHRHSHDGSVHTHFHSHETQAAHYHSHRALAVGALHGLAGSAALTLLVLTTAQSTLQGIAFILVFGAGSVISMLVVSTAIGLPFLLTKRFTKVHAATQVLAGTASVAIGLLIVIKIGLNGFFA